MLVQVKNVNKKGIKAYQIDLEFNHKAEYELQIMAVGQAYS